MTYSLKSLESGYAWCFVFSTISIASPYGVALILISVSGKLTLLSDRA